MQHLKVRFQNDQCMEVGVDEAGRGCLWGSLYSAAVLWPPEEEWLDDHREIAPKIKDSKRISAKKRAVLAEQIKALAIDTGIGCVSAQEIDTGGMSYANRLAFVRAIQDLSVRPDRILLDGCLRLWDAQITEIGATEQQDIVDGDALYLPIAAASILAKESRDSYVQTFVQSNPDLETKYALGKNKGYGTEKHRKGILEHGTHADHRRLFLRKLLGTQVSCQPSSQYMISDE
jgi:ribonuclease HII